MLAGRQAWSYGLVDSLRPTESRVSRLAGVARIVGLDVIVPLLVFQVAVWAGVPVVWALVGSGLPPLIGVCVDWFWWRTVEVVGVVVCGGILLSVVLALLTQDPRAVLLEGVVVTFVFGVVCLWSLRSRRPLIFHFVQAFYGGPRTAAGDDLDVEYTTYVQARRFWRTVTVVWAVGYMVESLTRALLVWLAPAATGLLINRTVPWVVYVGLMVWIYWWGRRTRNAAPATAPAADDA